MSQSGSSRSSGPKKLDRSGFRPIASGSTGILVTNTSPPKGKVTHSWANPFGEDEDDRLPASLPARPTPATRIASDASPLKGLKQDSFSPEKRDQPLPILGESSRSIPRSSRVTSPHARRTSSMSPAKHELPPKPSPTRPPQQSAEPLQASSDALNSGIPNRSTSNGNGAGLNGGVKRPRGRSKTPEATRAHGSDVHLSPQTAKVRRDADSDHERNRQDRERGYSRGSRDDGNDGYRERSRSRERQHFGRSNHDGRRNRYEEDRWDRRDDRNGRDRYDERHRDRQPYHELGTGNGGLQYDSNYRSTNGGSYMSRDSHRSARYDDYDRRSNPYGNRDRDTGGHGDYGRNREQERAHERHRAADDEARDRERAARNDRNDSPRRRTISGQSSHSRQYSSQGDSYTGASYRPDRRPTSPRKARSPSAEEGEISEGEAGETTGLQEKRDPAPGTRDNDGARDRNGEASSPPPSEPDAHRRKPLVRPTHRAPTPPRLPPRPSTPPPPPPDEDAPATPSPPPMPEHPPPPIPRDSRNQTPAGPSGRSKTPVTSIGENPYLRKHRQDQAAVQREVEEKARREAQAARAQAPLPSKPRHDRTHYSRRTIAEEESAYGRTFQGCNTLEDYDVAAKIGEGTFGVVTKAREKIGGRMVALKKLITHNQRDGVSVTTVREIKILKSLQHENVVPLLSMVVHNKKQNDRAERGEVFMVFPYMDHDLCGLLANQSFSFTLSLAKLLMRQLLEGLAFIHASHIIHRDIKTANILVNSRGQAMIADFGLARSFTPDTELPTHNANEYTNMVVTRWYRAPELLLGAYKYTQAVDLWSVGCILGELYMRGPIIAGHSDRDQLVKIIAQCGPLDDKTWPKWRELPGFPDEPDFAWDRTPQERSIAAKASEDLHMDRLGVALLMRFLTLDPDARITALDALDDIWFHVSPMPAAMADGLIGCESSHEMTTRREPPPAQAHPPPAYQQRPRPSAAVVPQGNPYGGAPPQSNPYARNLPPGVPPYGGPAVPASHMPPHGFAPGPGHSGPQPQYNMQQQHPSHHPQSAFPNAPVGAGTNPYASNLPSHPGPSMPPNPMHNPGPYGQQRPYPPGMPPQTGPPYQPAPLGGSRGVPPAKPSGGPPAAPFKLAGGPNLPVRPPPFRLAGGAGSSAPTGPRHSGGGADGGRGANGQSGYGGGRPRADQGGGLNYG